MVETVEFAGLPLHQQVEIMRRRVEQLRAITAAMRRGLDSIDTQLVLLAAEVDTMAGGEQRG